MRQLVSLAVVTIDVHTDHDADDVRFDGTGRATRYDDGYRVGCAAARRHVGQRNDDRR